MARGGRFVEGEDRETDGRPGNATDSPSYSRIFDRRGESEISNRPETHIQILGNVLLQREAEAAAAYNERLAAQSRVHVFTGVGKFIIPPDQYKDSWAAHAELIKDQGQNLGFNPERFLYFDNIIAEKLKLPALTDKNHRDYAKYEGLRTNLAVLRNDIIGIYVEDGSFDPEDVVHVPKIAGIAESIADGLKNDRWIRRPFAPSISMDVANVEAVGAREIYKYLLARQTKTLGPLEELRARIKGLLGMTNLTWDLPPLETTPFSDNGLAMPPPPKRESYTATELALACAENQNRLVALSGDTTRIADEVRSLETLRAPGQSTSTEEARKLFRYLRNLEQGDLTVDRWISGDVPEGQTAKAEALHRLVQIYSGELHKATRARPESFYDQVIDNASEAAGGIALGMATSAADQLPQGSKDIALLDATMDSMPKSWDLRSQQSVRHLLDTLEGGMRHMMGADVSDRSPTDRLVEFSERIRATANTLRRAEDMQQPAREESIELAREILRRLKDISFNDRPIEELARTDAETQATIAQRIEEMTDTYQNILAQAAQTNPDILKDPRVQQASDAVGNFAHAVSLMAAKEIHTDMAATQKISAEISTMPEEWKNMDGKTVGKLAERVEGGLEQAVSEIAAQQEQQRRDEELVQDAQDMHHHHGRRRRRRRSSGMSGGAMRKVDLAIRADDHLLGHGVHRENRAPAAAAPIPAQPGVQLRAEDLSALQAMSGNLRHLGDNPGFGAVDVKPGDRIRPDDQGAAAFVEQVRPRSAGRDANRSGNPKDTNRPTRV